MFKDDERSRCDNDWFIVVCARKCGREREAYFSRHARTHARKSVQARTEILMEYKPIDRDFTRAADWRVCADSFVIRAWPLVLPTILFGLLLDLRSLYMMSPTSNWYIKTCVPTRQGFVPQGLLWVEPEKGVALQLSYKYTTPCVEPH
jgi:hypothetical protein